MKTSRYSDSQIMAILKHAEAGTPVPNLWREHSISVASFYKWRAKFGGMDASIMSRLKELEDENSRLKKMYAEVQLQADVLKEAMAKKWKNRLADAIWPSRLWRHRLFSISVTCYRYQPKLSSENAEIAYWLIRLTHNQKDWCVPCLSLWLCRSNPTKSCRWISCMTS